MGGYPHFANRQRGDGAQILPNLRGEHSDLDGKNWQESTQIILPPQPAKSYI